jgi:signal transduction histidine kinase
MRIFRQLVHRFQLHERLVLTTFLVVAVALPTVFFLYFLRRSLAGEGALAGAAAAVDMRNSLLIAQRQLDEFIRTLPALRSPEDETALSPSEKFARAMERGDANSVLILAELKPAYPLLSKYRDLNSVDQAALQLREEKRGAAWLSSDAPVQDWGGARDISGRLILPTMQLQALLSPNIDQAEHKKLLAALTGRVLDYRPPLLPSGQRLFLAEEIHKIQRDFIFPFEEAEQLATDLLQLPLPPLTPGVLVPAPGVKTRGEPEEECWMVLGEGGRIAIFSHSHIFPALEAKVKNTPATEGLSLQLQESKEPHLRGYLMHDNAGFRLPNFEIRIYRELSVDSDLSSQRTQRSIAIGAAALAVIGIAGYFAIRRYLSMSRTTELRHDFLSTVSHELKTPLTSIRLLVETLCAGQYANPERTKQYAEVMQREIARLSHLVESFLTYTRLERGKLKFDFTETDPAQIAEHAVAIIGARFRGNCEFVVEIAEDLPLLEADSDTLITAVLNLLDNAHKYSPDKKHITFRVTSEKNWVHFSVEDCGIGLTQADCRRVLQRYYRVDSANTRGIQGAGLGLSIVKNVAEAHEGELTVRSELGKGSIFTVSVPVRNQAN